jgi:hypothetical protein
MRQVHNVQKRSFCIKAFKLDAVSRHSALVVIAFTGFPALVDMDDYEREYKRVYELFPTFLTIYDTRGFDVPNIPVIQRAIKLIHDIKTRTVQQVHATLVLTQFDFVRVLVDTLVRAGGQVAPFRICTTPKEVSEMAIYYLSMQNSLPPVFVPNEYATAPPLREIDFGTIYLLVVLQMFAFLNRLGKRSS